MKRFSMVAILFFTLVGSTVVRPAVVRADDFFTDIAVDAMERVTLQEQHDLEFSKAIWEGIVEAVKELLDFMPESVY